MIWKSILTFFKVYGPFYGYTLHTSATLMYLSNEWSKLINRKVSIGHSSTRRNLDELKNLLAHVFSPFRIQCEIMINHVPMRTNGTNTQVWSTSSSPGFLNADRGDLLIRGLLLGITWFHYGHSHNNVDSKSYKSLLPNNALERMRKRGKWSIANPVRANVAISHPSQYWRTKCSVFKPEHFSRGLQKYCRRTGEALLKIKGV